MVYAKFVKIKTNKLLRLYTNNKKLFLKLKYQI